MPRFSIPRVTRLFTVIGLASASTVALSMTSMTTVTASPARHTVTISGDCRSQNATSDWETVAGRVPRNPLTIVAFKPGDTLRVVNNCNTDAGQNYSGELFLQDYPVSWSMPVIPNLNGVPVFSDSEVWNAAPTANDRSYGKINRGQHVDMVLDTTSGRWVFEEMLGAWLGGGSVLGGGGGYYGSFIIGSLAVEAAGSSISQVFATQAASIAPINVTFTGYGSRGRIAVDNLPPGLSVTSTCLVQDVFCDNPAVIGGTPTQDGVFTVNFRGLDSTQGWPAVGFSETLQIVVGPLITPATQTISGTTGTSITSSTSLIANNFSGAVTYSVSSGLLPNGLTLNSSTGVVSGTPTVASNATITITATGATAGSATATVTFSIAAAAVATTTTTTTTVSTPTTVASTTTVAAARNTTGPMLVTSANQAALTASPGKASVLVNGVAVTPQIVTASNSAAAQADPAERTPEQVRELQQAAATIETRLDTIAGGDSGVSVVRTETGAVMTGVFTGVRVPVEDVVVVNAADTAALFAARDVRGNIVEVKPGAVLEVASNGDVAVQAFGLRPGESVELVVMSTPTLLGSFTVDAKGSIKTTAKLPTTIGSGNHSLVVASPSVKASLGLKLVKSSASLPITGSNTSNTNNWAVAVLLSGMYLVLVSRSRRRVL